MFNGYNDSTLISYEFNPEREKKADNVSKYSYPLDGGVQSTPSHPVNRQPEFWSGKPNLVGIPSVVNCNCTGCYPTTENQSYQVQSTRHRPWLPKTFSVPSNASNECKLPAYQWDNALNQICYSDPNVPYGQENGGKHSYFRQFQSPNQPGVIISANKQKSGMGFQNGVRQPVICNPNYDLTKRVNGRNYYDGDKYSLGAHPLNQVPGLPTEPYTKAVPSNLNQNRVPSTGHRKENSPHCDHYNSTKIFPENYHPGLSPLDLKNNGIHVDYSGFNRDPDFCRNNYAEIKRSNLVMQNRKDCSLMQTTAEQHYGRSKHPENVKGCDILYPNLEKNQMGGYIQRIENDGISRVSRPAAVCNDLRFPDGRPQVFPYQNNAPYRNYVRPEYSQLNSQCVPGFSESNQNVSRNLPQQPQSCDPYPQGSNGSIVEPPKVNLNKAPSYGRNQITLDGQPKTNYLETIRSEELTKNGTSKISPLRLLRKKKLVNAPQELSSVASTLETPTLDVRKFWSTWAEEEDENVSPTQMVVLDCQNIDAEQVKLLNLYESDPSRPVNFENVLLKNPDWIKDNITNEKVSEPPIDDQEKQVEISTQIESTIKDADEVIPEVGNETVNISPERCRTQGHRQSQKEESIDKWTEKKFDFLKRSEESKAAEIIRYEEEKKKIFERHLSQVSDNKSEKLQENGELRFEENSRSSSPKETTISNLPTSEYRRNKFLDYSEGTVNCFKDTQKVENVDTNQSVEAVVKKEEPDIKHEADSPVEVHDILQKISEIDLQRRNVESGFEATKKIKKMKKKKLDQQETDGRTDLKVETVSKPTIKFSIQKSHDLKISFKVLNKKYEEEAQSEEAKPIQDTNTELITLKYKSVQNGGKLSDSSKRKKKLRRKKHAPVLKIKRSKCTEEERDPLAQEDEMKTYQTDGFQVQETVDSAKIKLTFKRHKSNLETEYRIDSEGLDVGCEKREENSDVVENGCRKKSRKTKKHKTSDMDSSQLESKSTEQHSQGVCGFVNKNCSESTEEFPGESPKCQFSCSIDKEKTHKNAANSFGTSFPEERLREFTVQNSETEDSYGKGQLDLTVNCDEDRGLSNTREFLPDENAEETTCKSFENEKLKEKTQEISLDFTKVIHSPNFETNLEIEKTEEIEGHNVTEERDKNDVAVIESTNKNHSKIESSYELKNNLDYMEINKNANPVSLDEIDTSSKSDEGVRGITEQNTFGEKESKFWLIESGNTYDAKSEDHTNSKLLQEDLDGSGTEKSECFEPDCEKTVEFESEKTKIETENILIKMGCSEDPENRLDCLKENFVDDCKRIQLKFHKTNDTELTETSEVKLDSPLPLNETVDPLKMKTIQPLLSECNEIEKWVEPNQGIIKEGDVNVESLETYDVQGKILSIENVIDSENQSIDLPKVDREESQTFTENQLKVCDFIGEDEKKRFLVESQPNTCTDCETQDSTYELDTVRIDCDKFSCTELKGKVDSEETECDDNPNEKSDISHTQQIKDSNDFTEQVESENIDSEDLPKEKLGEDKTEPGAVSVYDVPPKTEEVSLENISRDLGIDHFICISDHINEKSDTASEKPMEVVSISQTEPETKVPSLFPDVEFENDEEVNGRDVKEVEEPEIEFDLSIYSSQNVSSQIEPKDCLEFRKEEAQTKVQPESNHCSLPTSNDAGGRISPETCDHYLMDCTRPESTNAADENSLEVVSHFKDDGENHKLIVYSEKPDEPVKQSETLILNDKLTLFTKPQENTEMENESQPDNSANASPVDHSLINSLTDTTEEKLTETSDVTKNTSPQLNELTTLSLESPSNQDSELEDGEIVDSTSDDSEITEQITSFDLRKSIEFKNQKPIRRHSTHVSDTESSSWCLRKFKKSKSCPPKFEIPSLQFQLNIPVEDIPLPMGPPPLGSCFSYCKTVEQVKPIHETKEKLQQISVGQVLEMKTEETKQELPCGSLWEPQNHRNLPFPGNDALGTHRSKIKFTLMKRNRFSNVGLYSEKFKVLEKPKIFEKSEPTAVLSKENIEQKEVKDIKKLEPVIVETTEKPNMERVEVTEKSDPIVVEFSKTPEDELSEIEKTEEKVFEPAKAEREAFEPFERSELEITKPFETLESDAVVLSEIVRPDAVDSTESLELEVVDSSTIISVETENVENKIRTPDFVSERIEEESECQIAGVPNTSPIHTEDQNQKSDLEMESLCEDTNVEIVDVLNDFMRDEFYEDIPTSEDLPNGDSVDEKVNDDKFRNIMQNCLENAKKFLNVGNLKLFSCSVDDLLELDNQENEPAINPISRDVLLTSCDDINDDLGLNERFQPVDIPMEFVPSDVCPEILPVDNWPYLEEEVPSSPLKTNETDLILENDISEDVSNRKRTAEESENHKRFRRKSLMNDEETLCSKIATHRRKTIDALNSFLPYTKVNGIDKPNESLKCRLSLEKLNNNGVDFICPQNDYSKKLKDVQQSKKLNYKSPLWQPKVMLIRISENEVKRLKKNKPRSGSSENINVPVVKKQKSEDTSGKFEENDLTLSIPPVDPIKELLVTSPDVKKHKPRFRNLHTKRKSEHEESQPKPIEAALSELFEDSGDEPKNVRIEKTNKNGTITESKLKSESKSDRHLSKSHKDKSDHRDRRRESNREHDRHREKRKHERNKHDEGKRHKSSHSDDDRKWSVSKSSCGQKEVSLKKAWVCEACGFDDANERVAHIKSHPFHCQSCHQAFRTETHFINHLTELHKDIRNQHHCLLCELSFHTEEEYLRHLETREHTHLEAVEKNTINTLFTLLTGAPCPVLGVVEMKPEWLPNQPGTVHFYHQATPLSLALQYLKMHRDLTSHSEVSKVHPN